MTLLLKDQNKRWVLLIFHSHHDTGRFPATESAPQGHVSSAEVIAAAIHSRVALSSRRHGSGELQLIRRARHTFDSIILVLTTQCFLGHYV